MNLKIIERTSNFKIYEADYMGLTQIFRIWNTNQVEIKFTDNFARANGHKDIQNMFNHQKGMRENLILACGDIPEWVTVQDDGKFTVQYTQNNQSLN